MRISAISLLLLIPFSAMLASNSLASAVNPVPVSAEMQQATQALLQGDKRPAAALLDKTAPQRSYELMALEILYLLASSATDLADARLTSFEQQFASNPETFAFSSEVWRSIGHQASIFAKRGYYKKAVKAKIQAGVLAPENPYYLTLQASALGQGDSYGGSAAAQKPLTDKIATLDKKWGYIARINLAQNEDDVALGESMAEQAASAFKQDFDVLERVAQWYWTIGSYEQAQAYFLQACQHRPAMTWHLQVKWYNACYQVGEFANDKQIGMDKGIKALNILLNAYSLPTEVNFDIASLLMTLADSEETDSARKLLQRIVQESPNKALARKAQKLLGRAP
ncbi:hypothetical protein [Bowmanella denitrificans]|uniref:hypothetical protein n=1 Tax=Bowmanella denitrificans TaxID=366582 RepID=UPI000C9C579E|nr:hypothetical protein [Bowmanella denitrificans]